MRSNNEFDPSEKLSLGYFSTTATNRKETSISKNMLKMLFNDVIVTSSLIKN